MRFMALASGYGNQKYLAGLSIIEPLELRQ
jgi:hypothetical protein